LIDPDPALIDALEHRLAAMVHDDGMFVACAASAQPLPDRWSTRRGSFLAKAAAGILSAADTLPRLRSLRPAARATLAASISIAVSEAHDETHPALYAIEGAIWAHAHCGTPSSTVPLSTQVNRLIEEHAIRGYLPESRTACGVHRLDVVAQVIRAGALLRLDHTGDSAAARNLRSMTAVLARHVDVRGALPFAAGAHPTQYSVWAAMFAEQALSVASRRADDATLATLTNYLV
jgi:hypothetical protein